MEDNQEKTAGMRRPFMVRLALWPFKGKGWRRFLLALLGLACLYVLCMAWVLHYPAVRGVVVDRDNRQPIPGVEVYEAAEGYFFPQEKAVLSMGGETSRCTSADGAFSFKGGVGMRWGFFWPLQYVDRVALWVYAKDYIPLSIAEVNAMTSASLKQSTHKGSYRREGEREVFPDEYGLVERERLFLQGWGLRIEMVKPLNKEQWEVKCRRTLAFRSENPSGAYDVHPEDAWVFQDLTAYLERWPEDDKAGNYLLILMDQIARGDSPANIDDELRSGELRCTELPAIVEKNNKILKLASSMAPPKQPYRVTVTFPSYEQRLKAIQECTAYLEQLSGNGGAK
jgi:hypothetical protein